MPYSRPWTTNRCRWVPVQPKATCNTACRSAIVVSAGISRRRQISGLTPRTTTRSWYTLGRGAGCMVSGMAPILASRCGRMAPGTAPPTVCPALAACQVPGTTVAAVASTVSSKRQRPGPAEAQLRSAGRRLDRLSVNAHDVPDVLDTLTGGVAWFGVLGEVVQRRGAVLDHGHTVLARGGAELGLVGATGGRRCAVGEQRRPGYRARVVAGRLPGGVREVHVERHALAIDQERAERAGGRSDRGRTGRGRHRG